MLGCKTKMGNYNKIAISLKCWSLSQTVTQINLYLYLRPQYFHINPDVDINIPQNHTQWWTATVALVTWRWLHFFNVLIFILCSTLCGACGPIRLSLPGGETGDPQRDAQGDQQGKAGDHWWWGLFEENTFLSYIAFSIFFLFSDSIGAFAQIDLNQVPS